MEIPQGSRVLSACFLSEAKAKAYADYWNKMFNYKVLHSVTDLPICKTDYRKFSPIPF